jgi:hypothetical protein
VGCGLVVDVVVLLRARLGSVGRLVRGLVLGSVGRLGCLNGGLWGM